MANKNHFLFLALLIAVAYASSLSNSFVSDDQEIVKEASGWKN